MVSPLGILLSFSVFDSRPSLLSFGAPLALNHIDAEPSANDGSTTNPLLKNQIKILGPGSVIRAIDGLSFATRDAL